MVKNFYDKYLILTFSHLHTIFYNVRNPTNVLSNITDHQVVTILREVLEKTSFSLQQDSSRNLGPCPLWKSSARRSHHPLRSHKQNDIGHHVFCPSMKRKIIYQCNTLRLSQWIPLLLLDSKFSKQVVDHKFSLHACIAGMYSVSVVEKATTYVI